jgi:protein-tyrosine-phosphatase
VLRVSERSYNILFLCTGNSARSIIAEALVNHDSAGRFHAYSAGSHPGGEVNPLVIAFLKAQGIVTEGARSKGWDEFARPGAAEMDFVITVCDNASGEVCPVWPGNPVTAHWGVEDPAAHRQRPEEAKRVIRAVFATLRCRIALLADLPLESLDKAALRERLREIGRVA